MTTEAALRGGPVGPRGARWPLWVLPVLLVVVLTVAQASVFTPIDPVRGTPQTEQPMLLWVAGVYGDSAGQVSGNRTVSGTTLLLGDLNATVNSSANWTISFPEAYDVPHQTIDYTFWIPAQMDFVHNSTPLLVSVDGHSFRFQPTYPENVYGRSSLVYGVAPDQMVKLPGLYSGFLGGYDYVSFEGSATPINTTVEVTITVPAEARANLPNIVFTAAPAVSEASASSAQERGWFVVPLLAIVVAAFVWAFRRLGAARVAGIFTLGVGVRLALAPVFLHTDLITLTQYPVLFYSYGILNLQSFIYGPTWLGSLIVPASPFYAAGLTPSTDAFNVLFKLTPIAFDGLTYLVLLRLIALVRDERTAYRWATYGWLLNPFVIYYSAVHGLDESAVAFFVTLAVYLVYRGRWASTAVSETLAVLSLYPAAFVLPPLLALKRRPVWFVVTALALPFLALAALFLVVYGAVAPAVAYLGVIVGSISTNALPTYGTTQSAQSPWLLLTRAFGVIPTPFVGLAIVATACLVLVIVRRPLNPTVLPGAVVLAMLAFYLSFQSFFVQLLIWTVPAIIVILTARPERGRRALGFLWGISLLALSINGLAPWFYYEVAVLSFLLFALLVVPILPLVERQLTRLARRVSREVAGAMFLLAVVLIPGTLVLSRSGAAAIALAVLVCAGLGVSFVMEELRPHWVRNRSLPALATLVTTAGALGYLFAVFHQSTPAVAAGILAISLVVVVYSLSRAAWLAHRWLNSDG